MGLVPFDSPSSSASKGVTIIGRTADRTPSYGLGNIVVDSGVSAGTKALQQEIAGIKKSVDQITQASKDNKQLGEVVQSLQAQLEAMSRTAQQISAPVLIPATEDMAVKLVPSSTVDRIGEYNDDYALYLSLAGVFSGGLMGLLVNTAQAGDQEFPLLVAALLLLVAGVFALRARTSVNRKKKLADQVYTWSMPSSVKTE